MIILDETKIGPWQQQVITEYSRYNKQKEVVLYKYKFIYKEKTAGY